MRDAGPRDAFGGRGRGVPVLELPSERGIHAGDAPGRNPAVEEGEVSGEERSGYRARVGYLQPGRARLVVVDIVRLAPRASVSSTAECVTERGVCLDEGNVVIRAKGAQLLVRVIGDDRVQLS